MDGQKKVSSKGKAKHWFQLGQDGVRKYKTYFNINSTCEESMFIQETTFENIRKMHALAFLVVLIMSGMILFDLGMIGAVHEQNKHIVKPFFIMLRVLIISCSLIFLWKVKIPEKPENTTHASTRYILLYISLNMVLLGVFTGFVQLIRDDISPYLMGMFLVASFLLVNQKQANLIYGISLMTMGICTWLAQVDKGIFIYNMANASIMTVLAWVASQFLYSNRVQDYLNRQIIEKQAFQLTKSNQHLQRLSFLDPLTNLYNRRHFDQYIQQEWTKAKTTGKPISLILVDIDHFKELNDKYGHQAGDNCLKQIGLALEAVLRNPDAIVARLGGDEFAVVIPETDQKEAGTIAQNMLYAVQLSNKHFRSDQVQPVTVSLGVACCSPHDNDSLAVFFSYADQALYQAKKLGRNQVVCL